MDRIDFQILNALQSQARTTNVELARASDLAPSTTLERVRRLEERGVIRGYHARLDPTAVGLGVQAAVMVNLGRHQAVSIEDFEAQIRAVPQVVACHHVTGRYDYLLQVVARDIDHLRELVTGTLAGIRGVEKQETFLVLSTLKENAGLPLEMVAPPPQAPPPKESQNQGGPK